MSRNPSIEQVLKMIAELTVDAERRRQAALTSSNSWYYEGRIAALESLSVQMAERGLW